MTEWNRGQFSRRRYVVEGGELDKAKKIELIVKVDGRVLVQMQAREPGMLAFVSKPSEQGFDIDLVEPVGRRFTDMAAIDETPEPVAEWQFAAMGLGPDE